MCRKIPICETETFIKGLKIWFIISDTYRPYRLSSIRGAANNKIMQLDKVFDIDETENLIKKEIFVSRSDFAKLDNKNDFYLNDLIGFGVVDENNIDYGKIVDILNTSANDIIIIDYKNKEIMIPVVEKYVMLFDFKNKLVKVNNIREFINL